MKTLELVISGFTARNIRDLISRNQASSTTASYKIACCSGVLSDKDFKNVERIPQNIQCSDNCRGLVINYRPKDKKSRFVCVECLRHIQNYGHPVIEQEDSKKPAPKKATKK